MAKEKPYGSAVVTRDEAAKKAPAAPAVAKPTSTPPIQTPGAGSTRRSVIVPDQDPAAALPFGRRNYVLMLAGIAVILAGFFIMSLDKAEFGFGFLGLTLGPVVVMGGFMLEFFAILARPKA